MITKVELAKGTANHPKNAEIIKLPWLTSVPVSEDDDVRFVAQLRKLWGSDTGRDHGEAEVVALCRRFGWTSIMDDARGRDAARRYMVPCVSTTAMLVAAAAFHRVNADEAWELHTRIAGRLDRPVLPASSEFKPAFAASIKAARRLTDQIEGDQWPHLLADTRLDRLVLRSVSALKNS